MARGGRVGVAVLVPVAAVVLAAAGCTPSRNPSAPTPSSTPTTGATQGTPTQGTPTQGTPTQGTPTGSAPAASTPTASPRSVTILGSGDVLVHPPLWQQAHRDALAAGGSGYDFGPMVASIAPDVRKADLATCELETPLAPPSGPFVGYPDFDAPPQVLTALHAIGYRTCTTASNHTLDQGFTGIERTLDELDAAGIRHTGSARSAHEAATPLIVTTPGGVRVGQVAYAFGFNGNQITTGRPWETNLIDVPRILAAAKALKRAGADVVVLSMHWGTEYDHLASRQQKQQAAALLASPDIDLVLGDHAHVIQPAQKIDGKWVFYCMGDQISRHSDPLAVSRQGVMPRVTFTEVSPHRFRTSLAEAVPTLMQYSPMLRLIDLPRALAAPVPVSHTAGDRRDLEAAHAAIAGYLDAYGAVRAGLRIR